MRVVLTRVSQHSCVDNTRTCDHSHMSTLTGKHKAMPETNTIELTGDIVSAYVGANNIPQSELPALIAQVHSALANIGNPALEPVQAEPPVPIKQTIKPDYIISLEDGKRYKSLRRHLSSRGLTPEQYRRKWGLHPDYPMVSPNYSKARSELAKALGLGQKRKGAKKGARKRAG
jgi:predicted transcriptional regulator